MLNVNDLVFRYARSERAALDGVTLTARRGEVLGLLGPNGAGKTTLISHLTGLLGIQSGEILLDGQALQTALRTTPTRIAIAPQEYAFYPTLSVLENLQFFGAAAGLDRNALLQRIERCMGFAQLDEFRNARAQQLSGGLKRRLNLAIALLPEPELVLLDEPTVGIDPQSRAFILDIVRDLALQGTTVIYTTHYMEEIEAIADQIVIMDHGRVLRAGTLNDLLSEGAPRMRLLIGNIDQKECIARIATLATASIEGEHIVLSLQADVMPSTALAAIEALGADIRRVDYGHYNLEHLFMSLTQRSLRDH